MADGYGAALRAGRAVLGAYDRGVPIDVGYLAATLRIVLDAMENSAVAQDHPGRLITR